MMDDLSHEQSRSKVDDETPETAVIASSPARRKRTAGKIVVTLLIIVFGLGAGWLAGKVLNSPRGDKGFAPDTDTSQLDNSNASLPAQTNSRASAKDAVTNTNSSSANPDVALDAPPVSRREPPPKPPATQAIPSTSQQQADEKDDSAGEPSSEEQSARDISRKAMRKIMKQSEKANSRNVNENRSDSESKSGDMKSPGTKKRRFFQMKKAGEAMMLALLRSRLCTDGSTTCWKLSYQRGSPRVQPDTEESSG
jgi:hypothetical protein